MKSSGSSNKNDRKKSLLKWGCPTSSSRWFQLLCDCYVCVFFVCHTELTSSNLNWSKLKVLWAILSRSHTAIKHVLSGGMLYGGRLIWFDFFKFLFAPIRFYAYVNFIDCLFLYSFSPNGQSEPPRWACALCALGLFFYQSLDAIDGKQARRTNSSSPLGELFDHGCDSISTIFVALSACLSAQLGFYPKWMFFQVRTVRSKLFVW